MDVKRKPVKEPLPKHNTTLINLLGDGEKKKVLKSKGKVSGCCILEVFLIGLYNASFVSAV